MQLRVFYVGVGTICAYYGIQPARENEDGQPFPEDMERLRALQPRIRAMAQRELGGSFRGLEDRGTKIFLMVSIGTATYKRNAFRDLCGWINLFDTEE